MLFSVAVCVCCFERGATTSRRVRRGWREAPLLGSPLSPTRGYATVSRLPLLFPFFADASETNFILQDLDRQRSPCRLYSRAVIPGAGSAESTSSCCALPLAEVAISEQTASNKD